MMDVRNDWEICHERKTGKWILKGRFIGKRKMKDKVKINENKIYIKRVITGCFYFVRWSHQSVKSNKNAKLWKKEPAELDWKCTGASLGQHGARASPELHGHSFGVLVPSLQNKESHFTGIVSSECERQSWCTGASWACRNMGSLERFALFWTWASQAETETRVWVTLVGVGSQASDGDWRQIMADSIRAQDKKEWDTIGFLEKDKTRAICTDHSIQAISNTFLSTGREFWL